MAIGHRRFTVLNRVKNPLHLTTDITNLGPAALAQVLNNNLDQQCSVRLRF